MLSHFRVYRKSAASAQADGRIVKNGPLHTDCSLKLGFHCGLIWDNVRQFWWDILLTQVYPNANTFQKIIPNVLSIFSHGITKSWNQYFVNSRLWDNFSSKDAKKHVWTYDVNITFYKAVFKPHLHSIIYLWLIY